VTIAYVFVINLLRTVYPVERVRIRVISLLTDYLVEKYKSAISYVNFLLEIELEGTPTTLNYYFNDNLEK